MLSRRIQGILICCLFACTYSQTTMTVSVSNSSINAIATYTFIIVFPSVNRTNYTLTLPPEITISNLTTLSINGAASSYTTSLTNNIVIVNKPLNGTVTILISNIKNPPSAIQSHSFLLVTDKDNLGRINIRFIQYVGGTLQACGWSFDGTTEQPNCNLTVTLILSNPILQGSNQIVLSYPNPWVYHRTKGLIYQSVTCSISFDGINYQVASCPSAGATTMTVNYNLNNNLGVSSAVMLRVSGVNCPPTTITPANSAYQVTTTDMNGVTIDSQSSCPIANVPATTYGGIFQDINSQPISLSINSNYPAPQIGFTSATFITFQAGDTLDVTPAAPIHSCSNSFYFSRGNTALWSLFSTSSSVRTYAVSADNIRFTSSIVLSFDCTIVMPASANTVYSSFVFQRSSIPYLRLSAALTSLALPLNTSLSFLSLSSYSMVMASTYTFSLTTSSPIGPTGQLLFIFPSAVTFSPSTTNGCSALMNGLTAISVTCVALFTPQNMIQVNLNQNTIIPSFTSFSVSLPSIGNPLSPIQYYFGITTYYNSSLPQSLVETSANATSAAYTVYNTVTSLSPASFSVFAQTSLTVTYISQVILPSSVIFTLVFPFTSVSFAGNIFVGGGSTPTVNPVLGNKVLTFQYDTTIPLLTTVTIPISAVMPSSIGNYSSIQFTVSDTFGVLYEQSLGSMPIIVNMSSPADLTVAPMSSVVAGVVTMYQFTLLTYIPHASKFILEIRIPLDTVFLSKYSSSSGVCTGSCWSVINQTTSYLIELSVNNSGLQSSVMSYTFNLGHFRNPRVTGYSMNWVFTTKTTSGVEMESGTAQTNIKLPNVLNGSLAAGDAYYRGNPNTVNFLLSLSDPIRSGDYILLASTFYTPSSLVQCAQIQVSCVFNSTISTVNTTVIEVTPLASQIGLTTLEFGVAGLVSSLTTSYNAMDYISVTRFASSGYSIDSGAILYQIDCGWVAQSNCMSCFKNGSCINCYIGMYLLGSRCVSNCSSASSFFSVNGLSGSCLPCSTNCNTCIALNSCLTCSNLTYYLYDDSVCRAQCDTSAGMIPYLITNTNTNTNYCSPCPISNCLTCTNRSRNGCTVCTNSTFLENGACSSSCSNPNSYSNLGQCVSCDVSCIGCTGGGNGNCKACSFVFYKVGVYCLGSCPYGTAAKVISSIQTCGCDAPCVQCASNSTKYCLTCNVSTALVFNGKCVGSSCPGGSFQLGGQCVSCGSGCGNCSINMCYWCLAGMFQYGNQCVHDCNQLGQQYHSNDVYCVLCPTGCDTCDGLTCTSCLPTYSLNDTSCVAICLLLGQCLPPNVIPDRILPLPGLLSLLVWSGLVLVLKLLSQRVYVPYSLLCVISVIEVVLGVVILVDTGAASVTLLEMDYAWRSTVRVMVIVYLVLNYVSNVVYLWLFFKYLKPVVMLPKQIDYIVNGLVLVLAGITNYRFGVLAFSRLFPKPEVMLSNASKLTPVHYICFLSMLLDLLLLASGGLLVYQEVPLTHLFMLGIDLLLVVLSSGAITIWMVSAEKPQEYYQGETKKYTTEDRDERNVPVRENQVTIQDQAYPINDGASIIKHIIFEDTSNAPLPFLPKHHSIQINSTILEDNALDEVFHFESCEDTGNETFESKLAVGREGALERKKKEEAVNFSKEKAVGIAISQRVGKTERKPSLSMRRVGGKSERVGDRNHLAKRTSAMFESEISDSNDQVIDLDTVIASKIRLSKADLNPKTREIHQEISPSLFNTQNQRFEIEDYDEAG